MEICRMKCRQIHLGPPGSICFVGTVRLPGDRFRLSLTHPTRPNLKNLAHSTFSRFMAVNMLRSERMLSSLAQNNMLFPVLPDPMEVNVLKWQPCKLKKKITSKLSRLCRQRLRTRVFSVFSFSLSFQQLAKIRKKKRKKSGGDEGTL